MNRLSKFEERGPYGEKSGRVAYAFGLDKLPEAAKGFEWRRVDTFRPADELLNNSALHEVFRTAIANGCSVIEPNGG
ncbi:hypothetical protein [Bradyrhizobium sp. ARR65]|uniref:hypothetical protein n=1 Tax=Bradyrhizobium sp. ARR65 TaxID=1040989 RepID=UPI000465D1AD|nr:hypothetical protein [Bradyrhizobium sp. ARR65]